MASSIDEVFSDFKKSLAGIDFNSYNPASQEFQSALNIGLMWHLLCEAQGESASEEPRTKMKAANDDIAEELYGAKKYFQKYLDSNDANFKNMARDELKHAEILIKKANAKLPSGQEKMKLKEYENELREIMSQVMK